MSLLNCITIFVIGSSLMTSSNFESEPINSNPLVPLNLANKLPDNLPKISGFNVPMIVKLVPYEVPAQGGTNYADVSLKISNTSRRKVEVEISQITVLAGESNYVLLNATTQELGVPSQVSMQPGDIKVFNYKLKSESKRYQRGQEVLALIYYRQDGNFTGVAVSNSEQVTVKNSP
jgi:hypothetical protein